MGILDFLKRKPDIKSIRFEEIIDHIAQEKESLEEKKGNILVLLKNLKYDLLVDLKRADEKLKNVNLKELKIHDRARFIIRENFSNYLTYFDRLIRSLNELESDVPSILVDKLTAIIYDFEKKSELSYQKSTYVIGELGHVKEVLDRFYSKLKEILEENKDFFVKLETLETLDQKLSEIERLSQLKNTNDIPKIKQRIEVLLREKQLLESSIDKIKKSIEYIREINKKNETQRKSRDYENDLLKLKSNIDFKQLAQVFHNAKDKMKLINDYKDSFIETFNHDQGEKLIQLLKDLNNAYEIDKKFIELRKIKSELDNSIPDTRRQDQIKEYEKQISDLDLKIIEENHSITRELKKQDKFDLEIVRITELIKLELPKLNFELIE